MTKATTRLLGLQALLGATLLAACFSERSTEPEDSTPCDGTTTACVVDVTDNSFSPRTLTVTEGSTVRWDNNGASPHTSTGPDWDSGTILTGADFEHTFDATGEFDYECEFHPGMTGTIVVE